MNWNDKTYSSISLPLLACLCPDDDADQLAIAVCFTISLNNNCMVVKITPKEILRNLQPKTSAKAN
jgi:hypothetical protein